MWHSVLPRLGKCDQKSYFTSYNIVKRDWNEILTFKNKSKDHSRDKGITWGLSGDIVRTELETSGYDSNSY